MRGVGAAMNLTQILSSDFSALESYMSACFVRNMEFFRAFNPTLFAQLSKPPTTHNLLCNPTELNILNLQDNALVYPASGENTMIATHLALSQSPMNNPRFLVHTNHLALQKLDEDKIPLTASICNKLINLMQESGGGKSYHLPSDFLPSCTFFGMLGGIFLQLLLERGVYFHSLLLFEEYLDMLRIMLYFVDFALLFSRVSERACYIFVKDLIHQEFIHTYFASRKITNNFLRLELFLYESPKITSAREVVYEAYRVNSRGWGSFDDEMIGVRNTLSNLSAHYPVLHLPKRVEIPICVVGNGVSLDSLLPFIKKNAKNMLIFSCGTAIKPLKAYGIEPDFQIEIERIAYLKDVLREAPLGDTTLLCGSVVQPEALELAKEAYVFMRGGSAGAYLFGGKSVVEFSAPYVGNAGFALAALLGEEVLMCGLDCGYIKGKAKHAKNSFYGEETPQIPPNAFKVQGNRESSVYSDALFSLSARSMERCIKAFAPRLVLNLGEGAYIQGTRACDVSAFSLRELSAGEKQRAIESIKAHCSADYTQVFRAYGDMSLGEVLAYKEEFLALLGVPVQGKRELFALIDSLHRFSLKMSAQNPFVGLLFEGSVGHILHNLMVSALHLPSDEIGGFYAQAVGIIREGVEKMAMSYRLLGLRY